MLSRMLKKESGPQNACRVRCWSTVGCWSTVCLSSGVLVHSMLVEWGVGPQYACRVGCWSTECLSSGVLVHSMLVEWGVGPQNACRVGCWSTECLSSGVMVHSMLVEWGVGPQYACRVGCWSTECLSSVLERLRWSCALLISSVLLLIVFSCTSLNWHAMMFVYNLLTCPLCRLLFLYKRFE